jgi:membrane-associated phospholipid phosphatase
MVFRGGGAARSGGSASTRGPSNLPGRRTWVTIQGMRLFARRLALVGALLLLAESARAETAAPEPEMPSPVTGMGRHLFRSFIGPNFVFHLAAVAETALLSSQGMDARVRDYFHQHRAYGKVAYPWVLAGVFGPVAVIGGTHLVGRIGEDRDLVGASYAVIQATALTLGYVTLLKAVTGRPAPRDEFIPDTAGDLETLSRTFRPGLLRGGVIAGWPSGHVAVTTAVTATLAAYYPESAWLKLVAIASVGSMIGAVTTFQGGGMHWFSDGLAGALMALPIALEVGGGFRRMVRGRGPGRTSAWMVLPSSRVDAPGMVLARRF